jgi:hypothetical protein
VLCTCRKGADLKERQIPEGEIDTAGASVMGGIVLRAQDKKDDKRDVIFERPSRGLCECTVVVD